MKFEKTTVSINPMAGQREAAQPALVVRELETADVAAWDAFVLACPDGTFFHRAGWKRVIEESFGHRCHFLLAERHGAIEGVLPLGHIRSLLFGNALISAPFGVYGGVAAVTDEARAALEERAIGLARSLGVDYLEFRHRQRRHPDWPVKDGLYVTFRKEILPEVDANLKAVPRKQRAMIRKGEKAGLRGVLDRDVQRFFSAYSESVRNLGTPVFGKRYFAKLREVFAEDCEVLTVLDGEDRLVSSVMSFYFRDEVLPYYGGGTGLARATKGNDFMYWDLMRRCCERGLRVFDYGRSKRDTGSFSFKKHWGFQPEPLFYEYVLIKSTSIPDISPVNRKFRTFVNLWQRLPLPISRALGPLIAKNLG